MTTADRIRAKCNELADLLVEKNTSYGDSALKPLGIFASGDPVVNLGARIDDKLARIKNDRAAFGEDPIRDLLGYLVLLQIAIEDQKPPTVPFTPAA